MFCQVSNKAKASIKKRNKLDQKQCFSGTANTVQCLVEQAAREKGSYQEIMNDILRFKIVHDLPAHEQPLFRSTVLASGSFNGIELGLTWNRNEHGSVHAEEQIVQFIEELMDSVRTGGPEEFIQFCAGFGLAVDLAMRILESILEKERTGEENILCLRISSSPCSTTYGTKRGPIREGETGCAEKIVKLREKGVRVSLTYGRYYQPQHIPQSGRLSEEVCKAMEMEGVEQHLDRDVIQRRKA